MSYGRVGDMRLLPVAHIHAVELPLARSLVQYDIVLHWILDYSPYQPASRIRRAISS